MIAAHSIPPALRRVRACFSFLPDANYDGDAIADFQRGSSRTMNRPIELVWDRLCAHHRDPVAGWLATQRRACGLPSAGLCAGDALALLECATELAWQLSAMYPKNCDKLRVGAEPANIRDRRKQQSRLRGHETLRLFHSALQNVLPETSSRRRTKSTSEMPWTEINHISKI